MDSYNRKAFFFFLFINYVHVQYLQGTRSSFCQGRRFGHNCSRVCHCLNNGTCHPETGECSDGCGKSWSGINCQRILLVTSEDAAYISATLQRGEKQDSNTSMPSSYAVDGNQSTCAVTPRGVTGWWRADMGGAYKIRNVYLATSNNVTMKGWRVLTGNRERLEEMSLCNIISNSSKTIVISCRSRASSRYVAVLNTHGALNMCQLSAYTCSPFFFGKYCEFECGCVDATERCDYSDGICSSGCRPGWRGDRCTDKCNMTYGIACKEHCGHCHDGAQCDEVTGMCLDGCKPGWKGISCNERCEKGSYGPQCEDVCGYCLDGGVCRSDDGHCPEGCANGWMGYTCQTGCGFGKYGPNCSLTCGHCKEMGQCNRFSGVCETGCRAGWTGLYCDQVCPSGTYGLDCAKFCENCKRGVCNKETGHCLEGCEDGWKSLNCNIGCPKGTYGRDCNKRCGKCQSNTCNTSSGKCPDGCEEGFAGDWCDSECINGYYGLNCSERCGLCLNGAPCDKSTGVCSNGCAVGYHGNKCTDADTFSDNTRPFYRVVLGVMITVAGGVMILVIICLVINWRREDLSSYDVISLPDHFRSEQEDDIPTHSASLNNNDSGHMTDDGQEIESRDGIRLNTCDIELDSLNEFYYNK